MRESGYYKVKLRWNYNDDAPTNTSIPPEWVVAYWNTEFQIWELNGTINEYTDNDFVEINEEKIQLP